MCPHYRRHVYAQVREKLVVAAEGAQGKLTEAVVVASSAVAASVAGSKTVRGRHRACVSASMSSCQAVCRPANYQVQPRQAGCRPGHYWCVINCRQWDEEKKRRAGIGVEEIVKEANDRKE